MSSNSNLNLNLNLDDEAIEQEKRKSLAELYEAARDENELLEFKNYELQFKIQELEQNQKRILHKLVNVCGQPASLSPASALVTSQQQQPPTTNLPPTRESLLSAARASSEQQQQQPGKSGHVAPKVGVAESGNLVQSTKLDSDSTEAQIGNSLAGKKGGCQERVAKQLLVDQHIGARSAVSGDQPSTCANDDHCDQAEHSLQRPPQPVDYCPQLAAGHLEHEQQVAEVLQTAMEHADIESDQDQDQDHDHPSNDEKTNKATSARRRILGSHDPMMLSGGLQQVAAITNSNSSGNTKQKLTRGATNLNDFVSNSMVLPTNESLMPASLSSSSSFSSPLSSQLTSPSFIARVASDDLAENEHLIEYNGTNGDDYDEVEAGAGARAEVERPAETQLSKPQTQQVGGVAANRSLAAAAATAADPGGGHDFPSTWQNYYAHQPFPTGKFKESNDSSIGNSGSSSISVSELSAELSTSSLPVDVSKSITRISGSDSNDTIQVMAPQPEARSSRLSAINKSSEAAKSLAKSQPNLNATIRKPLTSVCAGQSSKGAKIAIPVPVRSVSSGQQLPRSKSTLRSPMNYLHTRSKSSLDKTNTQSYRRQQQQQVAESAKASQTPRQTTRATSQLAKSHSKSSSSLNGPAAVPLSSSSNNSKSHVQLAVPTLRPTAATSARIPILAPNLLSATATGGSPKSNATFNRLSRSKSSTSLGFVTQIPTLIGHSHAQLEQPPQPRATNLSACSSVVNDAEDKKAVGETKLAASFGGSNLVTTEPVASAEEGDGRNSNKSGDKSAPDHDDSTDSLVLVANDEQRAFDAPNDATEITSGHQQPLSAQSTAPSSLLVGAATGDSLASAHIGEPAARTLAACQSNSKSLGCVASGGGDDDDDDGSSTADSSTKTPTIEALASESQQLASASGDHLQSHSTGRGTNGGELPGALSKTQSALSLSLARDSNYGHETKQQQPPVVVAAAACQQCKLFQSKLNILIRDRKQLNEQLSEMEEMENDSRLMSQKLAQQLNLVQLQLDACKLELDRSCHQESKLQFQNKRLHFELNQRLEVIQRLQLQLNRLQALGASASTASGANHSAARNIDEQSRAPKGLTSQSGGSSENDADESANGAHIMAAGHQSDKPTAATTKDIDNDNNNSIESPSRIGTASSDGIHRSPAVSLSGVSGSGDDGDSAIDVALVSASHIATGGGEPKLEAPKSSAAVSPSSTSSSSSSSGKSDKLLHDCNDNNAKDAAGSRSNRSSSGSHICEDSAYSKSSASSDGFNSDDGSSCSNNSLGGGRQSHQQHHRRHSVSGRHAHSTSEWCEENVGSQSVPVQLVKSSSSSSSSGDESDHHEQSVAVSESVASSLTSQQQQQQQPVGGQSSSSSGSSTTTSIQLSGRQQVMRKRISTARILRGAQVLNSAASNCGNLANEESEMSSLSLISQARYAQVVANQTSANIADRTTNSIVSVANNNNKQVDASGAKSPIERALEGVDDLESGKVADEVLRSLASLDGSIVGLASQQVVVVAASSESQTKAPIGHHLHNQSVSKQAIKQQQPFGPDKHLSGVSDDRTASATVMQEKLIGQFKQEIANLKMRLLQAHTLNDNLVAELRTTKEHRHHQAPRQLPVLHHDQHQFAIQPPRQQQQQQQQTHQQAGQSKVLLTFSSSITSCHNSYSNHNASNSQIHHKQQHQFQQQQQQQQVAASRELQMNQKRCSSVVYVNGLPSAPPPNCNSTSLSATNRDHHLNHHQQPLHHQQCVSMEELADFLHFLLDKLHSHHGRTFELVNECQKLTMSALLAGYSHQMNLIHHNSVVMAGNQFQHQQQQQQLSLQQQQGASACELASAQYPVRPPPRRRNAANRMLGLDDQQQQSVAPQAYGQQDRSQPTTTTTATSALQAAKQTLLSLVPIYHNSSSNTLNAKNQKKQQQVAESNESEASLQVPRQQQQTLRPPHSHLSISQQQAPQMAQFAYTIPAQHLAKVKSSLSEEIERHRVYFNGQLLDLLTRQNWCESLVAEKLKGYRMLQPQAATIRRRKISSSAADNSDSFC